MSTWTGLDKTLGGDDSLLLEDGFNILLEDGFLIILEQSAPGTILWTSESRNVSSWSTLSKVGIDDLLGLEQSSDILGTEADDNIGLEQSDSTGVTWTGTNKS